jgi:regulatory protein
VKSEKTLRRWLSLKGYLDAPIESAIARLLRAGLIDDVAHAGRMVETASAGGLSKNAIRRKLRQKGIGEEDAERALEAVSDEEQLASARRLAQRLRPRYSSLESPAARARLSQALARRGFSWDVIHQALSCDDE